MATASGNHIKDSDINEKLYVDFYFRILQNKKTGTKADYLNLFRDFIRQSNIHCSEQNMTELGLQKYKSELYMEYFKAVDDIQQDGLLSVVPNADAKGGITPFNFREKQTEFSNCMMKFKNFVSSFKKLSVSEVKQQLPNPVKPICGKRTASIFDYDGQVNNSKYNKESTSLNVYQKKTMTNKPSGMPEKRFYGNKKVCIQPSSCKKETANGSNVGFVSASSMYRNPLKQANNKSDASEPEFKSDNNEENNELKNHESFKNFDKKIVDIVLNEIMDFSPNIRWSDIAGLEFVKTTVQEIVIWPLLRPDIFTGLRAPPRGILLFGPPGTGKTLIGKCIATESNSTFFCISASSLASKWVGESEQMVRVLFAAARLNQPSVIFIDEIDSLLSQRSDKDQDFTRKLKTEFLVQFDGAKTNTEERVLVVGATNRPHELDEAARRRFVKRLYVPLPDEAARRQIIKKLIGEHQHNLSDEDMQKICDETKGYSGSDVAHLCKEAAMGPIRCIGPESIKTVSLDQVRPISLCDFIDALRQVRASVVAEDLNYYMEWNKKFGSFGIPS